MLSLSPSSSVNTSSIPPIHCQCQSIRCYLRSLSDSNSNRLFCGHEQSVSNNSSRVLDSSTLCHIHTSAQSDGGDMLLLSALLLLSHCTALSIFPHSFVSFFPPSILLSILWSPIPPPLGPLPAHRQTNS